MEGMTHTHTNTHTAAQLERQTHTPHTHCSQIQYTAVFSDREVRTHAE